MDKKKLAVIIPAAVIVIAVIAVVVIKIVQSQNKQNNLTPIEASDIAEIIPDMTEDEVLDIMNQELTEEQQEALEEFLEEYTVPEPTNHPNYPIIGKLGLNFCVFFRY